VIQRVLRRVKLLDHPSDEPLGNCYPTGRDSTNSEMWNTTPDTAPPPGLDATLPSRSIGWPMWNLFVFSATFLPQPRS